MIGLCDVTDIHDAPTAPDPLGICIHCNRPGVELVDLMDYADRDRYDEPGVVELCVFCRKVQ